MPALELKTSVPLPPAVPHCPTAPMAPPPPPSLLEQVKTALSHYALGDSKGGGPSQGGDSANGGVLREMYDQHGLSWEEAGARRLVEAAAKQIGASVAGRGESSYSLEEGSAQKNATRLASVHKYLQKLVKKKAESIRKQAE